jgi:hypothetical protein
MKVKFKKCKECKEEFLPKFFNQKFCFKESCQKIEIKRILDAQKRTQKKEWSKRKREIKERLKTRSERLNDLQKIFNKFIRLRDKKQKCISCDTFLKGKYDAGHYFSVGNYPELRFNEDNCHAQCVYCNRHLHGNINEYSINIVKRIGKERVEQLENLRNKPLKLTEEEIEEKKMYYNLKIKNYESNGN